MSIYSPDAWVVVKLSGDAVPDGVLYKILAGWKGGYTSGDSWKLNSGITKIEETEHVFNVYGYSGSIYSCYKDGERMMMITQGIDENVKIICKCCNDMMGEMSFKQYVKTLKNQ